MPNLLECPTHSTCLLSYRFNCMLVDLTDYHIAKLVGDRAQLWFLILPTVHLCHLWADAESNTVHWE